MYQGVFLFQVKYFDHVTDRMVFKELTKMEISSDKVQSEPTLHFANSVYNNNNYILLNFRNAGNTVSQVSYKINNEFPQLYAKFIPENLPD